MSEGGIPFPFAITKVVVLSRKKKKRTCFRNYGTWYPNTQVPRPTQWHMTSSVSDPHYAHPRSTETYLDVKLQGVYKGLKRSLGAPTLIYYNRRRLFTRPHFAAHMLEWQTFRALPRNTSNYSTWGYFYMYNIRDNHVSFFFCFFQHFFHTLSRDFCIGPGLDLKLHPGVRSSRNSMKVLTARTDVSYLRDYKTGGEEGYAGRFCAFRVFLFFSNPASPISPVHSLCLSVGVCGTSPSPQGLNAPALFYASSPWQGI